MIDFKELNDRLLSNAVDLVKQWLPGGAVKMGREYVVRNPKRPDSTAGSFSINIRTGVWSDFAMGDVGGADMISLYAYIFTDDNQKKAADELEGGDYKIGAYSAMPEKEDELEFIVPAPKEPTAFNLRKKTLDKGEWVNEEPVRKHRYHTSEGELLCYVCTYGEGKNKDIRAHSYIKDAEGNEGWRSKAPKHPPLYGLDLITKYPKAVIILMEGEKDADNYNCYADPNFTIAITWMGGAHRWKKADFSPIYGRSVAFWPDNDIPGFDCIEGIHEMIVDKLKAVKFVIPPDRAKGWDCSDYLEECSGMDLKNELAKFMKARAKELSDFKRASEIFRRGIPTQQEPDETEGLKTSLVRIEPTITDVQDSHVLQGDPDEPIDIDADIPFKMLGFEGGTFYYLPKSQKQVITILGGSHGGSCLLQLAHLNWWEQHFKKGGKAIGADWMAAASWLISRQQCIGPYNPENQRGFGCWIDKYKKRERIVYHLGNKIWCDGKIYNLSKFKTKYIYEWSKYTEDFENDPLEIKEACKLNEMCDLLALSNPIHKFYLSGWLVTAVICGALNWRPHIQITGPAGSGKTTVIEMSRSIIGPSALSADGDTTEAGLRAQLKSDTRALIFDEFENEGKESVAKLDKIFGLLRQASSEKQSGIIKGTASGKSIVYKARTSAMLSGITVNVEKAADKGRICVIELISKNHVGIERKIHMSNNWKKLKPMIKNVVTDEWCKKFRARCINNIRMIRENAVVFSGIIAENPDYGSERLGDQIGTLFAGAYSLESDFPITVAKAKEFLEVNKFDEEMVAKMDESKPDEVQLIQLILDTHISFRSGEKRSVLELYNLCQRRSPENGLSEEDKKDYFIVRNAREALNRHGLDAVGGTVNKEAGLYVADTHRALQTLMNDTRFNRGWGDILRRIVGVRRENRAIGGSKRPCSFLTDEILGLTESDK